MKIRITEEWLLSCDFKVVEQSSPQHLKTFRRCIGRELTGVQYFLDATDLCIDVSPCSAKDKKWFVWITKCNSARLPATTHIHVRYMEFAPEIMALYEALTGRKFVFVPGFPAVLGKPLF